MRRLLSIIFAFIVVTLTSCGVATDDDCDVIHVGVPTSTETIKSYKIIIHKDVPANRMGLILEAAYEWVTASSGAVTFEVTYGDFAYTAMPMAGELRIYTDAKADKSLKAIGFASTWGSDDRGHPIKSKVWIQNDLTPRTYYLVAMHEIGHAIGLHHFELRNPLSIMYPSITDVGDHPTCIDRVKLCELWECAPGC